MRKLSVTAAAVLGATCLAAPAAQATTFDGSCQVVGEGGFASPAGYLPTATEWWMTGRGGCTGKLDGVSVVNHRVRLEIRFDDPLAGCAASLTSGQGRLRFAGKPARRLSFTQTQVMAGAAVEGAQGGRGLAYLTAYTQLARQDPAAVTQCATQSMTWFAAEWAMKTLLPLSG